eukprot:CAMPEP_0170150072 /NCGR_PEP_ID=MMETSP0033_2-20121228/45101_1 /TAXON_ID=195969 /ORGANISM="Dolichomastix tenuilepis, Strain CCMP3274" /LENGTH=677 /DNA_ID=CAMNT_0010387075 /DNA_START=113 /DNA_END=2143 /DNA_ORIENTATION=+
MKTRIDRELEEKKRTCIEARTVLAGAQRTTGETAERFSRMQHLVAELEAEAEALAQEGDEADVDETTHVLSEAEKRRRKRRAEHGELLASQREALALAKAALEAAEQELRKAEGEVAHLLELEAEVAEAEMAIRARTEAEALATRREAHNAERRYAAMREAEATKRDEFAHEVEEAQRATIESAKTQRKHAALRVREAVGAVREREAAVAAIAHDHLETRTNAVLTLKHSMEASSMHVLRANAVREAEVAKQRKAQEEESAELLAHGKNPYEVFRRRAEDARVAKEIKRNAEHLAHHTEKVKERLKHEEEVYQRELQAQQVEKAFIEKFEKEMGPLAREERMQKFMTTHTKDGREILDPTGRSPLFPSEATDVKTWKFGADRGQGSKTVTKKMQAKYHEEPNALLLQRTAPEDKFKQVARRRPRSSPAGGADENEEEEDLAGVDEPPQAPDELEETMGTAGLELPALKKVPLSTLEKRHLKEKRERVQITSKQIVWGREFKGDPFLPNPTKIVFRDFEPGRRYKKKISLTNVSFSFCTFKVLELEAPLSDFFTVEYDFPGKMSAGMVTTITVTFEPKQAEDIVAELPLLTETGPMTIPLECYLKRVDARLLTRVVDFDGVTLRERGRAVIALANEGALETECDIVPEEAVEGEGEGEEEAGFTYPAHVKLKGYSKLE